MSNICVTCLGFSFENLKCKCPDTMVEVVNRRSNYKGKNVKLKELQFDRAVIEFEYDSPNKYLNKTHGEISIPIDTYKKAIESGIVFDGSSILEFEM